jgi:hypothetical protein
LGAIERAIERRGVVRPETRRAFTGARPKRRRPSTPFATACMVLPLEPIAAREETLPTSCAISERARPLPFIRQVEDPACG